MKFSTLVCYVVALFLTTLAFCEFFIYYAVLSNVMRQLCPYASITNITFQCHWPAAERKSGNTIPVRAMLLADTHLLGPFRGHWWDKLRREWQMHRAFQTAVQLFYPEYIFFLGDLFDEGQWVDRSGFWKYVQRFQRLFHTPEDINVISVVGNHDVGFHYRLRSVVLERFNEVFNKSAINVHSIRGVHFVTINSMAMENDGCRFCESAIKELIAVGATFDCSRNSSLCKGATKSTLHSYSRPIVLQHFPTYRISDENCVAGDMPNLETYRENWEVLSKESTDLIGKTLNPRVAFSGHTHHYCKIINRLQIEEYSISSFSWRNKNNPSFLLVEFTPQTYTVSVCYLPQETTVIRIYGASLLLTLIIVLYYALSRRKRKDD